MKAASAAPVISLITLGCAKNLVDSERVLGMLAEAGFLIAHDPSLAEICLVNTCGFIGSAREETGGVLEELAALKARGTLKKIVVLGCLVERAEEAPEFARFLQLADLRLGFKDYSKIAQHCRDLIAQGRLRAGGRKRNTGLSRAPEMDAREAAAKSWLEATATPPQSYHDFLVQPRLRTGALHSAYLKISEGCSNPCRFCAIPRMRGRQVSRPIEDLALEARQLVEGGAREINLIAQDTTSYGRDLYGRLRLPALLKTLGAVDGVHWLRLLYAYPRFLSPQVLDTLGSSPKFCRYLDVPLQHISDPILRAMGRGVTRAQQIQLLELIERRLPGCAVRSAFIVGFPGETDVHFQELRDFVAAGYFTHAGVFLYSPEPLTPAARRAETVPLDVKKARAEALMQAQREVSRRRMRARVGQTIEVLVESRFAESGDAVTGRGSRLRPELRGVQTVGRSQYDAPEVDGVVYLKGPGAARLQAGQFVQATVVRGLDYDIVAQCAAADGRSLHVR